MAGPQALAAGGGGGDHGGGDKKKEEAKGGEGGGGGGGIEFFSGGSVFVKTQPILMPIIDEYGPQQFVTFVVAVEVKDLSTSDKVRAKLPRLIDAYMTALYGKIKTIDGKVIDIEDMKRRLVVATMKEMGEVPVEDVLVQNVVQRIL